MTSYLVDRRFRGGLGAATVFSVAVVLASAGDAAAQNTPSPSLVAAQNRLIADNVEVTYARDIAPIVQETCQQCHQPGGVAPFSLMTYEDARRVGQRMLTKVKLRQMPPFPIDPVAGIQEIKDDPRLTNDEIAMIDRWVNTGMPLGDPADMPEPVTFPDYYSMWRYESVFGRAPDIVLTSPKYLVRANGMDQWPNLVGPGPNVDVCRMAMAIEARPKDPNTRYVFHHGGPSVPGSGELMNSPSGKVGEIWPTDAGKKICPSDETHYSMHFFPIGQDLTAEVEWGLWLYPQGEEPKYETEEVQHRADQSTGAGGYMGHNRAIARRSDLMVPPNGQAMFQGHYVLNQPARIHSMRGHMHSRGKYQMVQAIYPDGKSELIAKLDWDHGWHTAFMYEEHAQPLLPEGTVLIFTSIIDNNPHRYNHDTEQWITAGSRTMDEMSHIWVGITYFGDDDEYFQQLQEERARVLQQMALATDD